MVGGPLVLVLALSAVGEVDEARGKPADLDAARKRLRLGGSVSGLASFAVVLGTSSGTIVAAPKGGLGLSFEIGVVGGDAVKLFFQADVNTSYFTVMTGGGF